MNLYKCILGFLLLIFSPTICANIKLEQNPYLISFEKEFRSLVLKEDEKEAILLMLKAKDSLEEDVLMTYLKNGEHLAIQNSEDSLRAEIQLLLGRLHKLRGEYGEALLSFLNANNYFLKADEIAYAKTLYNIGDLFFILEEFPTAMDYYRTSLLFKKKYPYKCNLPFAYWCMAEVHYSLKNIDSAKYYYQQSSLSADTIRNIPFYGNEGLAKILVDDGKYLNALEILKPVKAWYEKSGVNLWMADLGLLYMEIYLSLENDVQFQVWTEKTNAFAFNQFLPEQQSRFFKLQYKYNLKKKKINKALGALEKVNMLNEEVGVIRANASLASILLTLKDKESQLKSKGLENEKKISEFLVQKSKIVFGVVILLIVILLLITVIALVVKKKNKNINYQLKSLKEKDKQIYSLRMKSHSIYGVLNHKLEFVDINDELKKLFSFDAIIGRGLTDVVCTKDKEKLFEVANGLKDFEKVSFNARIDPSKVIEFSITNCIKDPSVGGFLLEGKDLSIQYESLETEKLSLLKVLKEKDLVIHSTQQKVAMSNLKLALNNDVLSAMGTKLDNEKVEQNIALKEFKKLLNQADSSLKHWNDFTRHFDLVHYDFFKKLKLDYGNLTSNDERHCVFLKLKMTNKEVANIIGITPDAVKKARQRLRKKMNFENAVHLKEYILSI